MRLQFVVRLLTLGVVIDCHPLLLSSSFFSFKLYMSMYAGYRAQRHRRFREVPCCYEGQFVFLSLERCCCRLTLEVAIERLLLGEDGGWRVAELTGIIAVGGAVLCAEFVSCIIV